MKREREKREDNSLGTQFLYSLVPWRKSLFPVSIDDSRPSVNLADERQHSSVGSESLVLGDLNDSDESNNLDDLVDPNNGERPENSQAPTRVKWVREDNMQSARRAFGTWCASSEYSCLINSEMVMSTTSKTKLSLELDNLWSNQWDPARWILEGAVSDMIFACEYPSIEGLEYKSMTHEPMVSQSAIGFTAPTSVCVRTITLNEFAALQNHEEKKSATHKPICGIVWLVRLFWLELSLTGMYQWDNHR